jgi:hypothetical protein
MMMSHRNSGYGTRCESRDTGGHQTSFNTANQHCAALLAPVRIVFRPTSFGRVPKSARINTVLPVSTSKPPVDETGVNWQPVTLSGFWRKEVPSQ